MVVHATMTDNDGTLRRMPSGDIIPFDLIWNGVLEMETDFPEAPDSSIRQLMMRRFEELKLENPDETAPEVMAGFRRAFETLYKIILEYKFKEEEV